MISSDPWLITIDDFLTDEEADILIYFGKRLGLKRSTDTGVSFYIFSISLTIKYNTIHYIAFMTEFDNTGGHNFEVEVCR